MHTTTLFSGVPFALLPCFNHLLLSKLRKIPAEIAATQTLTAVGHSCQPATQDHCPTCAELCEYTGVCLISLILMLINVQSENEGTGKKHFQNGQVRTET